MLLRVPGINCSLERFHFGVKFETTGISEEEILTRTFFVFPFFHLLKALNIKTGKLRFRLNLLKLNI